MSDLLKWTSGKIKYLVGDKPDPKKPPVSIIRITRIPQNKYSKAYQEAMEKANEQRVNPSVA